jgi:RNase H-fold protein (predicted Holliday junction resolvase)
MVIKVGNKKIGLAVSREIRDLALFYGRVDLRFEKSIQ